MARAAAFGWRMVRAKLALGGVPRPLEELPSLHAVLDVVEHIALEAKAHEGEDGVQRLLFELYKPDEYEAKKLMETADTDTGFDAFAALGLH